MCLKITKVHFNLMKLETLLVLCSIWYFIPQLLSYRHSCSIRYTILVVCIICILSINFHVSFCVLLLLWYLIYFYNLNNLFTITTNELNKMQFTHFNKHYFQKLKQKFIALIRYYFIIRVFLHFHTLHSQGDTTKFFTCFT